MASSDFMIPGLISGLNTQDIIQKMMDAERRPLDALKIRKDNEQKRADALRDVNTRLGSLLSVLKTLNLRSTIDAKIVTTDTPSSSPLLVSATANSDAALGSHTLRIETLATPTTVVSGGAATPQAIGKAVTANVALATAGFGITPTTGTFSVNGAKITIDDTTVLSDGVDAPGSNTVFAKIQDATTAAGAPVTVSFALDANGRQNKIVLTSASTIQLGGGSDTSNFLTAVGLAGLPPATSMTSARNIGGVSATANLSTAAANLDVALGATGSFKINGVTISYTAATDTLNSVISRINSSAANVTASYDSTNDRVTLTSKATGSVLIDLEDVTGNFIAAMKLSAANETVGVNAHYYVDGAERYSSSNTVTDALSGVTLNLKRSDPATTVTLTVGQDTDSTIAAVNNFVKQYNSTMDLIRDKTAYDANSKTGGTLLGDSGVLGVQSTLASIIAGTGVGLSSVARSLADIGITTGSVGIAPGAARNLVVDSSKLTDKLLNNPSAVADAFGALVNNVSLVAGGTGSVASSAGTPSNHVSGTYTIVSDVSGNLTATFTPSGGGSTTVKTGTIAAGGANSTLIPGLVLTGKGTLAAGTDTITVDFSAVGVGVKIADYLSGLTSSTGVFADRQSTEDDQIKRINDSINKMQDKLDQKEQALYAKFRGLEVALSRLQNQGASLSAQLAKL